MNKRGKKEKKQDAIYLGHKKKTWLRFIKIFPKCNLPWITVLVYVAVEFLMVNVGISATDYTAQLFAGDTSAKVLRNVIITMIGSLLLSNISIFVSAYTSARINRNMRGVMLKKVLALPMSFFKGEDPQESVYRITNNATVIDSTIVLFIIPIVTALYQSGSVFFLIFKYDWRLSLTLIIFIPIQIFIAFIFGRINYSLSEMESGVSAKLVEKLSEMIRNIPMAKAFAKEKAECERGEELTSRLYRLRIKGSWLDQANSLSEVVIQLLQAALICILGVLLVHDGSLSVRAWVTFYLFSSVFSGAIDDLSMYWNNVKVIQGAAERLCEIMDATEEQTTGNEACENLRGDIRIEGLKFRYEEENPVLKGVNAVFEDNKITAIVGESGCGKSTLINLINRLYDPEEGKIYAGDKDISKLNLSDYRSNFITVPQNPLLFSGTIRENVCYGLENVTDEALNKALKDADAMEFVSQLKGGLDFKIGEMGEGLSGGQKQKLAFARALLSPAHYLILDEPTASMDAIAVSSAIRCIKERAGDRLVIVIAHTKAVIEMADHIVAIENGVDCSNEALLLKMQKGEA